MIAELRERFNVAVHESPSAETALDHMVGLYLEAAGAVDTLKAFQADVKEAIGEVFLETGVTDVKTSAGRVYVSSPSVRVSYDRSGLDALMSASDELARILAPFRKESEVAGTLTIRGNR